jgi:hypothetical protein
MKFNCNKGILIWLIIFVAVLTNCKTNNQEYKCYTNNELIEASIIKEVKLDVAGLQYNHEFSQTIYFDNTDWYIGLDIVRNCLDIFDLTNQEFHKSLCFKNDGSEGSIEVTDFYVHNRDSLIIFSEDTKVQIKSFENHLVNEWGLRTEKIVEWSKEELTIGFESSVARIYYDSKSNKLFIPSVAPVYYSDDNYFNAPTLVSFNLEDGEYDDIGNFVPDDMKNKGLNPNSYSDWYNIVDVDDSENLLISYCGSNFYSKGKLGLQDNLSLICRKSSALELTQEFNGDMNDINHQKKYTIENGLYRLSFYHSKYNYYITSVRHNQDFKKPSGLLNNTFIAPFSILVLNNNYEHLKEIQIPKEKYNFNKVYPHSEGVLIMKENPNDENNEEDLLEFSVFAID